MLNDLDRATLAEVHHWLKAATGVCGLLMLDDEVVNRYPARYLHSVTEAQAVWPQLCHLAPVALETLAQYLRRVPRES